MQYSELRQQYENLRRPFHVTKDVPHTNVWTYPPVPYYPGKHPCEKPLQMMLDIISACTRPGDVIAVGGKASSQQLATRFLDLTQATVVPDWLECDRDKLTGKIARVPSKEEIAPIVNEQLIVEFYSR